MAEAREVMDQVTKVVLEARDLEGVAKFLASDVVAVTPGVGQIEGREQLVDYIRQGWDAFPDGQYQSLHKYESGNGKDSRLANLCTRHRRGWFDYPIRVLLRSAGLDAETRACAVGGRSSGSAGRAATDLSGS